MPGDKKAKIIRVACVDTKWRWIVDTDDGDRMHLCGPGAPKEGKVGDTGMLRYVTAASFGNWFWEPDKAVSLDGITHTEKKIGRPLAGSGVVPSMTPEELQEHAREYMAAKAYYRAALEAILTAFGSSLDITSTRLAELDTHIEVLSEDLEQCAVELSAINTQTKSEDTLIASVLTIIQEHPEGVLSSQIAEESGIDVVRVRSTVATLKGRGQVESTKIGNQPARYRVTGNPATRPQQLTPTQVQTALDTLPQVFRAADLAKLLGRPSIAISSLLYRLKRGGIIVTDLPGYYTKTG